MRTFVGENEKCESLELDGGADCGKNRTAFLLDVLHDVALLLGRVMRILDDAGAHESVLVAKTAFGEILNVEIQTQHPAVKIEHTVDAHIELRISLETLLIVARIVVIRTSAHIPCLHQR